MGALFFIHVDVMYYPLRSDRVRFEKQYPVGGLGPLCRRFKHPFRLFFNQTRLAFVETSLAASLRIDPPGPILS